MPKETALERQQARHEAALLRIEAEKAEQEARTAQFVARWNEEHAAQCGTASGYNRHRRHEEEPCDACRKANREANRKAQARRLEKEKKEGATAGDVMRREMADPTRMSCCGAPMEPEPSKKYEQRHRQLTKTPVCGEARACVRLYTSGGRLSQTQLIELEKQELDRADCCGAPYEFDGEVTKRYRKRHNREGTATCRWAAQSANGRPPAPEPEPEPEPVPPEPERMPCCGAPTDGSEGTAKYAKRHWVEKTDLCDPARQCRNLSDRARWIREHGEPRELEPCGTPGAFKRHLRAGEEPCQECRDAHNARKREYDREYRRREREREREQSAHPEPDNLCAAEQPVPVVERTECCGAPVDGSERAQKYVWRHKKAGTSPCPAAKECRNSMDRKIYKSRKCADDVNERRRERRGWTIDPETQMPCCGAPRSVPEPTGKFVKRHEHQKTKPCREAKECRNLRDRKGTRPPLQPCGTWAAYRRHRRAGETPCEACREADTRRARNRRAERERRRSA